MRGYISRISSSSALAAFTIVALGAAVYSNALRVPFYFDDVFTIIRNPLIKSLGGISALWRFDPSRFVTYYSFALNYHFGGLQTAGYHVVNIALHLVVSITFFLLLRRCFLIDGKKDLILERTIFFAALIFLTHPLQTQAVTYISQRSTLLASLFYMLTIYFYLGYRREGQRRTYVLAILSAAVGLFTKPIVVTLPLALLLCDSFFCGYPPKRTLKPLLPLLPFFALAMVVPLLLVLWKFKIFDLSYLGEMTRETERISRKDYLYTQFNVIMTYVRLLFFPVRQSLDYDFPLAVRFWSFPTWLSFAAIAAVFSYAVRMLRRQPALSFGIFWFFLTLSLESSVFPIRDVIFEHRLYLPMAGFAVFAAWGLAALIKDKRLFFITLVAVVTTFAALSYNRNNDWRDPARFHEQMIEYFPNKGRLYNNLGNFYVQQRRFAEAKQIYEQAIAMDQLKAYNNLANIYTIERDYDKAVATLQEGIARNPNFVEAYYNLGNVYLSFGDIDPEAAFDNFRRALEINPQFPPAIVGMGRVYLTLGDTTKARFFFQSALRIDPGSADAYTGMGDLYLAQRQYDLAEQYYRQALDRDPGLAVVRNNYANLLNMRGQKKEAIRQYRKAIADAPDYADAYRNLANVLYESDQPQEARRMLEVAEHLAQRYRAIKSRE